MDSIDTEKQQKFRTEKVAPEGGWGYLIPFGIAIPAACSIGSFSSFGLLFNDFLDELGAGTSAVTIITGSYFSAFSFAGLFASSLFKKFPMRNIGLFGAALLFLGSLMTAFATSVEHLIVSFGIMEGAGIGFMIPVAYTSFNYYFDKRRVFIMSLTQTLKGFIIMSYPIVLQFLVAEYGFRGAALVVAALHGHAFFGMIVMHPIEWHYKTVKVPIDEDEPLMDSNEKIDEVKVISMSLNDCEMKPIAEETSISVQDIEMVADDTKITFKRSISLDATQKLNGFDPIKKRFSSIMSLGDLIGDAIITESYGHVKNGKWQKIVEFLDLTLFKDLIYVNIVLGNTFALYSDSAFFTLLPMYMFKLGFDKPDTALVVSIAAAADLGSRIFLALSTFCVQIKARNVILIGVIATIIFRLVFLTIDSFSGIVAVVIVLGFFRTFLHVTVPLAFADHLSHTRFASGYGLYMFLQGNFSFIIAPFIGYIRDATQSYVICFNSLTFIMSLCAIPWIIEMIWFRFNLRQIKNETDQPPNL
ncbi:monocarboxylate transporter 14-like [Sitodiplosis mosellana]|uniref:monocarboxylate transporter 14-like n=1 Tax=Sitodiplosis mosellana TaxID=263140 RepID=UPI0024449BF9|nr:monocarboxylate transporter 14-like [Sitodiplosis mosellana]